MTTSTRNWFTAARQLALTGAAALLLAACTGGGDNTGSAGPTGPEGPPGGGVPPGAVASATSLQARINRAIVSTDGRPVVDVFIGDQSGLPVTGLPAGNIRFVMARLEPAVNGKSSTWHALTRRLEAFPGTPAPTPTNRVTGTGATNQGYTETGSAGTWVDNRDGTYRYTFSYNAKTDAGIAYDASLPHRVGLEIRTAPNVTRANLPANNAVYTFVPATDTKLEQSGREIVDNDTCNACHDNLVFHGGARFDLQYCAMCHDSYSFDAQSGNSLDLKVMIHKIHAGETLPSVEAGGFYGIFGFGNVFTDLQRTRLSAGQAQLHDVPRGDGHRHAAGKQLAAHGQSRDLLVLPRHRQLRDGRESRRRRRDGRHLHRVPWPHGATRRPARPGRAPDSRAAGGREVQVRGAGCRELGARGVPEGHHPRRRSDQRQRALRHPGRQRSVPEPVGLVAG